MCVPVNTSTDGLVGRSLYIQERKMEEARFMLSAADLNRQEPQVRLIIRPTTEVADETKLSRRTGRADAIFLYNKT